MLIHGTTSIALGLKRVFVVPRYVVLALVVCAATFAFAVWLPNLTLLSHILGDPGAPLFFKLRIPLSFLGSIGTNFTLLSASYVILISAFSGINVAITAYYLSRRISAARNASIGLGVGGMVSSVLGIGCAACGSVVFTGLLSIAGVSGALVLLPLRGGEFGILGIRLLGISIAMLAKKVSDPLVCRIESK